VTLSPRPPLESRAYVGLRRPSHRRPMRPVELRGRHVRTPDSPWGPGVAVRYARETSTVYAVTTSRVIIQRRIPSPDSTKSRTCRQGESRCAGRCSTGSTTTGRTSFPRRKAAAPPHSATRRGRGFPPFELQRTIRTATHELARSSSAPPAATAVPIPGARGSGRTYRRRRGSPSGAVAATPDAFRRAAADTGDGPGSVDAKIRFPLPLPESKSLIALKILTAP
jgi:hypothetical protein